MTFQLKAIKRQAPAQHQFPPDYVTLSNIFSSISFCLQSVSPENRHLIWHSACTAGTRLKLRLQSACNKRLDTGSFNCTFVIQGPQPLPLSFPVVLVDKLAPKDPKPHSQVTRTGLHFLLLSHSFPSSIFPPFFARAKIQVFSNPYQRQEREENFKASYSETLKDFFN